MLSILSDALMAQVATSGGFGTLAWLAIVFFVLAIVAYLFGANGIAGMSAGIGRTLMFVFLVLFLVFMIFGLRA